MPARDHAGTAASLLRDDAVRTAAADRLLAPAGAERGRLDVLAAWAAQLLGSGSGRISLLGGVQTRVAAAGPQPEDAPGYPARDPRQRQGLAEWLCTQTAASGRPLPVDDARADARVAALWPVTDGGVGAYLGVPVLDAAGRAVGAVCVFDPAARSWTPQDVALLEQVATAAASELELSALSGEYEGNRALLELTLAAAEVGTFDLDLVTRALRVDDRLLELSELDAATFGGTPDEVYATIHPEDRDATVAAVERATTTGGTYAAQYRVRTTEGLHRWLVARGAVVPGADGTPARLVGAVYDVTGLREGATRTEQILDAMAVGYLATDADGHVVFANAEAVTALGLPRDRLVGAVLRELFPAAVGTEFDDVVRRVAGTGRPVTFQAHHPPPLDTWYEVRATPEAGGVALYFLDVTARTRAQHAAEAASARLELLAAVSAELAGTLDAEQAVASLARLVVPALGDWCLVSLLVDDDVRGPRRGLRDIGSWHRDEGSRDLVQRYARHRLHELDASAPLWQVVREDRPAVIEDATATIGAALLPGGRARELLRELAPSSGLILPLRGRGRTVGLISLFTGPDRDPLSPQARATATDVADRAGLALDAARLYRQQRDLAAGLQQSLLTEPPQPDHGQVVVRYVPASEAAQVGGDWYDAFLQPDGATVLVIGDVVGHDTRAAAAMSQVRTVLRAFGATSDDTPARLLARTDEAMANLRFTTTATALVARLEQTPAERAAGRTRLRWSSAGHPPAVVVHADGRVEALTADGADLLLGVVPDLPRHDHEVVLDRGATLVLCTDGLVERRDQSLDAGLDRLRGVLAELAAEGCDLDALVDGTLRRMLPPRAEDDVAVIAVRLHREDRPRPAEAGPRRLPPHVAGGPA